MQDENWIPIRIECSCGEIYVVRVEPRLGYTVMPEFSCGSCRTAHSVPGPILGVSRWVDGHWERDTQ